MVGPGFFQGSGNSAVTNVPQITETLTFDEEENNGDSSTADTIDWGAKNKQKSTLTDNVTYTFTDPDGPSNLLLRVIQGGAGSYVITWPANVKWPNGGSTPTLSTTVGAIDIVAFYFDGTDYYGNATSNFA